MEKLLKKGGFMLPVLIIGFVIMKMRFKSDFSSFTVGNYDLNNDISHYARIADTQFNCMKGLGTNEDYLFSSIEQLNGEELKAVYNAFGSRNYSITGQQGITAENNILGVKLDLFGWYKKELSKKELTKMRMLWNGKGVNVSF